MTTTKVCENPKCGSHFEDKTVNQNAKYCSAKCQTAASYQRRKSKGLSGVDETLQETANVVVKPKPTETGLVKRERMQLPVQLDAMTQFIVTRLEREIDDLRDQIKKRDDQISVFQEKEKDYEKQIVELNSNINAKPKGLSGFLERNSDLAGKAIEIMGPRFSEGLGKLMEVAAKKIDGPSSPHAEVVTQWLVTQPVQVQDDVVNMLRGLIALGDKMPERISEVTRSLMAASTTATEISQPKTKLAGIR